jgi:hypothetical protein
LLGHASFRDWTHINERPQEHEASVDHITNMNSWSDLKTRLGKHDTTNKNFLHQIITEKELIRQVLLIIIAIVKYLTKCNSAFRGSSEQHYNDLNGNLLACVEMVTEFDLVMQDYIRHIQNKEIHHHSNGLIYLMGSTITIMVSRLLKRPYISQLFLIVL